MKKILLFAGVAGVLVSGTAVAFETNTVTYAAFPEISYDSTHPYASKKQADGSIKINHATTKYVQARKTEANNLVTALATRTNTDNGVVTANKTAIEGTTGATTWAAKGLQNNRQVTAGLRDTVCDNLTGEYSGCGYITMGGTSATGDAGARTDGTGANAKYKWVKIKTNCCVQGQESAANCTNVVCSSN